MIFCKSGPWTVRAVTRDCIAVVRRRVSRSQEKTWRRGECWRCV